jgi:hypothetical protein
MQLEEIETQSVIFDSLSMAEKVGRALQKDVESYEDLFERLDE